MNGLDRLPWAGFPLLLPGPCGEGGDSLAPRDESEPSLPGAGASGFAVLVSRMRAARDGAPVSVGAFARESARSSVPDAASDPAEDLAREEAGVGNQLPLASAPPQTIVTEPMRRLFGDIVREARAEWPAGGLPEPEWSATLVVATCGLGEVRVHLRRAGRRLVVRLQVGGDRVREMLTPHLGDLVAALAVPGLAVEASVSRQDPTPNPLRRHGCSPSHPPAALGI